MKLYSYSSESLTYEEVKWTKAKIAASAILIGAFIFFGFSRLDQSAGNALGSRSANRLAAENGFLRQQISLMSPRVSKLEIQARQLIERDNKLHMLLRRRKIVADTLSRFTYATKGSELQSMIPAATSLGR